MLEVSNAWLYSVDAVMVEASSDKPRRVEVRMLDVSMAGPKNVDA
jgi:hypothetical protein